MILDIVNTVGKVAGKVIDRVLPEQMSEAERAKLKFQAELMTRELLLKEESGFRQFVLEYEGRAKDVPPVIQVLRASVRPVLTYIFALTTIWLVWRGQEIPTMLYQMDLIMIAFWFGERAVRNYVKTKKEAEK